MRATPLPCILISCAFLFHIACERNTPRTEKIETDLENAVPHSDSIRISEERDVTVSLHDSLGKPGIREEDLPLGGQPDALADRTIGVGRAGAIRIGMQADSVYFAYGRSNVRESVTYVEGHPVPVLEVRLPGNTADNPSLLAGIGENRGAVWSIDVFDHRFHTEKDIGPGSTFTELRTHHPVDFIGLYEIGILVVVGALEMAFELDASKVPQSKPGKIDAQLIPGNTRITRVIVGWR